MWGYCTTLFPVLWDWSSGFVGGSGSLAEWMTCWLTIVAIVTAFMAFRDEQKHRRNENDRNFQGTLLQLATTFYSSASARGVRIALDGRESKSKEYFELKDTVLKSLREEHLDDKESLRLAQLDEYLNFFNSVAIIAFSESAGDGTEGRVAETSKHFDYYLRQIRGGPTDRTILEYAEKNRFTNLVGLLKAIEA